MSTPTAAPPRRTALQLAHDLATSTQRLYGEAAETSKLAAELHERLCDVAQMHAHLHTQLVADEDRTEGAINPEISRTLDNTIAILGDRQGA